MIASSRIADGNMSARWGDPAEAAENRKRFVLVHGWDPTHLTMCSIPTPNGTEIHDVGLRQYGTAVEADALVSDDPDIVLGLLTADCVPLVVAGQRHIAIAHCGWESTHARLPEKLVHSLVARGEDASTLIAQTGPAIAAASYVQPIDAVSQRDDPRWQPFITYAEDGAHIDVPGYVSAQLLEAGVARGNVTLSEIDTYADMRYFSHRRTRLTGDRQGRLLTLARIG